MYDEFKLVVNSQEIARSTEFEDIKEKAKALEKGTNYRIERLFDYVQDTWTLFCEGTS